MLLIIIQKYTFFKPKLFNPFIKTFACVCIHCGTLTHTVIYPLPQHFT